MRLLDGPWHQGEAGDLAGVAVDVVGVVHRVGAIPGEARGGEDVLVAVEGEGLLGERPLEDLQGLREDRVVRLGVPRIRHRVEVEGLHAVVAPSHAELQAPAAELIQERHVFGEAHRVPERDRRGSEPDAERSGACRDVRRHHQRIGQVGAPVVAEVVLGEPEAVEAGGVAEQRHLAHLRDDLLVGTLEVGAARIAGVADLHAAGRVRTRVFLVLGREAIGPRMTQSGGYSEYLGRSSGMSYQSAL